MASKRVRQLRKGVEPSIISKNTDVVVSLREIAAGNIGIATEGRALNPVEVQIDTHLNEAKQASETKGKAGEEAEA